MTLRNMVGCILFVGATVCSVYSSQTEWPKETVLTPGSKISLINNNGTMTITYLSPVKRRYSWNGGTKVLTMLSRKEKWYGSLGIYSQEAWPFCFLGGNRDSRILAEEATLNFISVQEFLAWHNGEWNRDRINIVYNNSGLAGGWCISPSRNQINVDIWQILINGKIPKHLPGANDSAIKLIRK